MGVEFELKYAATREQMHRLRAELGGDQVISMETTYFDTPDRRLTKRHLTLRMRLEDGSPVCTVKTPLSAHARGEWACACGSIGQAIAKLCAQGAPDALAELTAQGVEPVCGARFKRTVRLVRTQSCTVEIALDEGVLFGGGKEEPLREMEVEMKSGDPQAVVLLAEEYAAKYGLKMLRQSKFRRAFLLAEGERDG